MKVLVTDKVSKYGVEILKKEFDVDVRNDLTPETILDVIGDYDGLIVRSKTKVTKDVLAAANKLKVVGRAGVGVDNIDIPAATEKGVMVINAPEGNTIAATEHTMAMMLAMTRHIPQAHQSMEQGEWDKSKFMGVELRGKTLGVLGLGRIGSGVAKRCQAFDMKVLAYDPFVSKERAEQLGVEIGDLDTVLTRADFLTLHLPLTKETKNLINEENIAKMKDGVRIVNCARGGAIVLEDLAAALDSGKVAGAALDVFPEEPLENNPLKGKFNVVMTPHLGASTVEAQEGVAVDVAHGIVDALHGEMVKTALNVPPVAPEIMQVLSPYFRLAEQMGTIGIQLAEGRTEAVEVEYAGDLAQVDTKVLTTAVVKGLLNPILQESVNYVNAPGLAKARNIEVKEIKTQKDKAFTNSVTVTIKTDEGVHTLVGVLFDRKTVKIVEVDGYRVDVQPHGWLLLAPHIDKPNMIGQIATILGTTGININGMQVGQTVESGKNIMAIAVDGEIPPAVMTLIRSIDGILNMKLINCNL